MGDLKGMQPIPDVIVYDTFLPFPLVVAHCLKLPAIGFVSYPGPGVEAKFSEMSLTLESKPWVHQPKQQILETYGYDLFQHGFLVSFVSPFLNLVTTIDDFYSP